MAVMPEPASDRSARPPRGAASRGDGRAAEGFTLIEMLVTLAIIGIASALGLQGMSGISARRRTLLATDVIVGEINMLRADAMRSGQRGGLVFEPQLKSFLSTRAGSVPIAVPAASVSVETRPTSRARPGEILLLPDGSSTGGRILLGTAGATIALEVSALTGRVRLSEIP